MKTAMKTMQGKTSRPPRTTEATARHKHVS